MSERMPFKVLIIDIEEQKSSYLKQIIERYWFNAVKVQNFKKAKEHIFLEQFHICLVVDTENSIKKETLEKFFEDVRAKNQNLPFLLLLENKSLMFHKIYQKLQSEKFTEFLYEKFDSNDLMLCIKNLIRSSKIPSENRIINYKNLKIDLLSYKIFYKDILVSNLGTKEYKILQFLLKTPQIIVKKEQIKNFVWGIDRKIELRTIDVHINRIRKTLKAISQEDKNQIKIVTFRSHGYSLI
ncbi:MAG: response regulator transcription factor [Rickettsia sp.]|nr:response regulator transcription factor [Rickettsia sp.]